MSSPEMMTAEKCVDPIDFTVGCAVVLLIIFVSIMVFRVVAMR